MDEPVIRRKSALGRRSAGLGDGGDRDRTHDSGPGPAASPIPERIGRFRIRRPLGTGGMSVVYEAYDDRLDRTVAIKLLRKGGRRRQARLQREAQALARLCHPNVVEVYEVGMHEGQAFIAMEQVLGLSLDRWLATGPRDVPEIVQTFIQAGRGLAAAHAAGLVHRDFKPSNVLVGDDGRVRVFDFGLARGSGETLDGLPESGSSGAVSLPRELHRGGGDPWEGSLTRTGAMLGTPAYMSPEQYEGKPATASSDQFAFCVALFEALFQEHPFVERRQWEDLPKHVMEGRRRELSRPRGVSAGLQRVVARGLARLPAERWPSMDALLAALSRALQGRNVAPIVAGAGAVLGLTLLAGGLLHTTADEPTACTGAEQRLHGVWDDEQRAQVRAAMLATDLRYAEHTWQAVQRRIDGYAQQWVDGHREACLASERQQQDEAALDGRMACLERRRRELASLVEVLAAADASVVEQAIGAVGQLDSVEACARAQRPGLPRPADPALVEPLAELRGRLGRALALQRAGQYELALRETEPVVARAEALGYAPLQAEAQLRLGTLHRHLGAHDRARAELERAYFLGKQAEHDEVAREAATLLVFVLAQLERRPDDALAWAKHARVEAQRDGSDAAWGLYLHFHGTALWSAARYDEALAELHQALVIYEAQWGDDHPEVAGVLNNIGLLLLEDGRAAEALGYVRRSLAIREAALGPEHPEVGKMLNNQGLVLDALGRRDEALDSFGRAYELRLRVLGPDHPDVAKPLANIGSVLARLGQHDDAVGYLERARTIRARAHGSDSVEAASMDHAIGQVHLRQGRLGEALAEVERAVAVHELTLGPDHAALLGPLTTLAEVELALGRLDDAHRHAAQALTLAQGHGLDAWQLAPTRFVLARVQWGRGEHEAARREAELAHSGWNELEPSRREPFAEDIAALDAWRAERDATARDR